MDDFQKQIEALKSQLTAETKRADVAEAAQKKAESDLATASEVIAELKAQVAEQDAQIPAVPTLKVGKETYEFVGGAFHYKGQVVTIDALKDNAKLAAELVKEGVSALRLLEKA